MKKVAPTVNTVSGHLPPSYEEANAGCASYCYADGTFSWKDENIRRVFIRKVYSILMLQLVVTLAIVALFIFSTPVRLFVVTHPGLYSLSNLLFLGTYLTLSCCRDIRGLQIWSALLFNDDPALYFWFNSRQFPFNIILLTVFTLSMACMLGFISSFYNTKAVILCLGITAVVCLCVTIFSLQSRIDITSFQGVLFTLCMVMLCCALVMGFVVPFGYVPWLHAIYGIVGAIVFTMFLAFDTQLLMGNKQYALSPEEYIFATLSVYLDIVYLFTFLLQLFGDGME